MTERDRDVLNEMRPVIRPWLDDAIAALPQGDQLPDRVRELVVAEIAAPPKGRGSTLLGWFESALSATRFVVAGVIVALFGGFLLAGVLTQPSDERPSMVGAPASARPGPTEAGALEGVEYIKTGEPAVSEFISRPHERRIDPEDQQRFKPMGMARSEYRELAFGPDGTLWLYDTMGFYEPVFPGMGHELPTSIFEAGVPGRHVLPDRLAQVNDLELTTDGTLWLASGGGLASFDGEIWTTHWDEAPIAGLDVAPDGTLVAVGGRYVDGQGEIVIVRANPEAVTVETVEAPPGFEVGGIASNAVVVTPDGSVWFGAGWQRSSLEVGGEGSDQLGFGHGSIGVQGALARYDGETVELVPIGADGVAPGPALAALAVGPDGSLWAIRWTREHYGRFEPSLAHYDDGTWKVYATDDGLPARVGNSLAVDSNGTVWLALNLHHESGGVASFNGEVFTIHAPESRVWELVVGPDDSVWWTSEVATPTSRLSSFSEAGIRVIRSEAAATG